MDLLVGCPVWRREWVLGSWFDYVDKACSNTGITPRYAFTLDRRDALSRQIIDERAPDASLVLTDEDDNQFREDNRDWSQPRIRHMVWVRNLLLKRVRHIHPEYFLSLDSDILLAPEVLPQLLESSETFDAVGGKCYLTPHGREYPTNGMMHNNNALLREDTSVVISVDVIMAIKLMTPMAYRVDYQFHAIGEDIGWSVACGNHGLSLGYDGRTTSKHVMAPGELARVDERCGY